MSQPTPSPYCTWEQSYFECIPTPSPPSFTCLAPSESFAYQDHPFDSLSLALGLSNWKLFGMSFLLPLPLLPIALSDTDVLSRADIWSNEYIVRHQHLLTRHLCLEQWRSEDLAPLLSPSSRPQPHTLSSSVPLPKDHRYHRVACRLHPLPPHCSSHDLHPCSTPPLRLVDPSPPLLLHQQHGVLGSAADHFDGDAHLCCLDVLPWCCSFSKATGSVHMRVLVSFLLLLV